MILRVVAVILVFLILGVHFLREGNLTLMFICFFVPFLLLIKRRWSLIVIQVCTYGGGFVWLYTMVLLVQERMLLGSSWVRMAVILSVVAMFTGITGALLHASFIEERYPR
jgi:hypothetical protein